jgi:hypothetical protein
VGAPAAAAALAAQLAQAGLPEGLLHRRHLPFLPSFWPACSNAVQHVHLFTISNHLLGVQVSPQK